MTTVVAPDSTLVASRVTVASLIVAGPLWAAVSIAQVVTRDGFDLMRHPLSLLSTGALGWIQIANFVLAGALLIVGAAALPGRWSPRLIRAAGAGMIAAGALVMDPGSGFPAGTPDTVPSTMSWHAIGHMAAGTVTFTTLIAACYVLARHYSRDGSQGMALGAALAGTALLAGDGWAMSGGSAGTLTLAVGAITAMCFLSVAALNPRP
ncbi:hypothetical protein AMIS_66700 [Actinoplanes missouriensis 431]|uniref:DUF998 domain-containing protein n=1 Tax=Actinoplanes missouriensis (strain ATCC 14538 / DSM 43046 / CBS 188.64 / JCM 3121 / NBRC 102363 / NCIMB 12654 / NRRL B-3342 / UNCC 431) TaxID=512565 RepID=I0HFV3_ACTM4|nr:DUF998 domain-containing protein [Actinoplanes missouriensis]BAL91890.1 hypothetical protein AMIS_66700 [Actinoplanes missouriensis 431]